MGLFDGWQGFDVQEERKIGRGIGEEIKLIKQVCCKLDRGQSVKQIAVDLIEDEEHIKLISEVASKYAPDYDVDKIYNELHRSEQNKEDKAEVLVKA